MITPYRPLVFSEILAYMLQNVEYQPRAYIAWLLRTKNYKRVMYRRDLVRTKAALLFRLAAACALCSGLVSGGLLAALGAYFGDTLLIAIGVLFVIFTPVYVALLLVVPLILARILIQNPKEKRLIALSEKIFAHTKAVKIAVAGSYGKTSMKELLGTVLSQGKKVAITPANKNVAISHALFAQSLKGDEDVLIVEFGEGKPGDVAQFSATYKQDIAVITGIAPAHLDRYATLDEVATDIFSATNALKEDAVYVNAESKQAQAYVKSGYHTYTQKGIDENVVSEIVSTIHGVSFTLKTKQNDYSLSVALLGRHTIGPVCATVAIAEKLGLTKEQIEDGVAALRPYEHRMSPRQIVEGAWLIDDTYNGNIDGLAAGLHLLAELEAGRKIYVTPGLVDQGPETQSVHERLGTLIANASPDVVVLMKNSVTDYIVKGMNTAGYSGELRLEDDPLHFYKNIDQFVASGDVVLMQNDWPDNYA